MDESCFLSGCSETPVEGWKAGASGDPARQPVREDYAIFSPGLSAELILNTFIDKITALISSTSCLCFQDEQISHPQTLRSSSFLFSPLTEAQVKRFETRLPRLQFSNYERRTDCWTTLIIAGGRRWGTILCAACTHPRAGTGSTNGSLVSVVTVGSLRVRRIKLIPVISEALRWKPELRKQQPHCHPWKSPRCADWGTNCTSKRYFYCPFHCFSLPGWCISL